VSDDGATIASDSFSFFFKPTAEQSENETKNNESGCNKDRKGGDKKWLEEEKEKNL
jgi:hypothetical protein